jgi:hypothetical protein
MRLIYNKQTQETFCEHDKGARHLMTPVEVYDSKSGHIKRFLSCPICHRIVKATVIINDE